MIRALIIENEAEASNALSSLIEAHCKNVLLLGVYAEVDSGIRAINEYSPDLIFLDVELNGESGFDLLEKISTPSFEVIFTTAYSDYALRAIKHTCLEYLMKPVSSDELRTAVQKFDKRQSQIYYHKQLQVLLHNLKKQPQEAKLCIPVASGFLFLNKSEIVMCKAEANYSIVYAEGAERIVCSKNLGFIEDMIDEEHFFRCHKSYLVNLNAVREFSRKEDLRVLLRDNLQAEVSLRKKDELLDRLKKIGHNEA